MSALLSILAAGALLSSPELGKAEGQCRPNESGPAFLISIAGLKDHAGKLKVELYPANDEDFLQDDNILLNAGKTFRRIEVNVPAAPVPEICIRAPAAGNYALIVLHDRDANRKLTLSKDGIGFPGNPRLGWSKPKAGAATAHVGPGPTRISLTLQYRTGLFSFGPVKQKK